MLTVNHRQEMVQNWMRRGFKGLAFRIDKGFLSFWTWGLHDVCNVIQLYLIKPEYTAWQAVSCAVQQRGGPRLKRVRKQTM